MKRRNQIPLDIGSMTAAEFQSYHEALASERTIQEQCVRELHRCGWLTVRINGGGWRNPAGQYVPAYDVFGFGSKGMPDVVAYRGDRPPLFVEVKRRGGKLRPSQEKFARLAAAFGITVHVVESVRELRAILDAL